MHPSTHDMRCARRSTFSWSMVGLGAVCVVACTTSNNGDASSDADAAYVIDSGTFDSGVLDAGHRDAQRDVRDVGRDDGLTDAGPPPDYGPPIIPPTGPLTMESHGGPVLSRAELVTIDWSDFASDAAAQALGDFLPTSNWIHTCGDEYGVTLAGHSHFTIPGATPTTLTWNDLSAIVDDGIASGRWPAHPGDPTAEPIWMFLVPSGVAIDSWLAAHFSVTLDGGHRVLAYAHDTGASGIGLFEIMISHEVIEALTDPYVPSAPAYRGSGLFEAFSGLNEDEVADVCIGQITESGHSLCRSWSNASSLAGHSPCVPMAPGTFVGVQGPAGPIRGAPGTYFDVTLTAIGDDPTATFDIAVTVGAGGPLGPALNRTRLHPGDTSQLTINIPPDGGGPYYLRIDSMVGLDTVSTWPVEVYSF